VQSRKSELFSTWGVNLHRSTCFAGAMHCRPVNQCNGRTFRSENGVAPYQVISPGQVLIRVATLALARWLVQPNHPLTSG
jgi:hypothetical protein